MGSFLRDIVLQVLSFDAANEYINIFQQQATGITIATKTAGYLLPPYTTG